MNVPDSDDTFVADLDVRYRDVDEMGHVNNAVYVTYLEQARVDYFREVVGLGVDDLDNVVASLEVDYERSLTVESDLRVTVWVASMGRSSLRMCYAVRDGDQVAATAETTQVVVGDDGRPRPVPDEWRELIREFEGDRLKTTEESRQPQ
ncbi:acyl-CoA thioesterase [Halobium salinum]|uniref:Acyl-CoA thioesterase n=1 Tax=Halobium salinum TaxID=1364940 RepID=A0ABD5PFH2_9EURY|nr:thioesterase family protein [Halobium salinum]